MSEFDKALGDVIKGEWRKHSPNLEDLAKATGIPYSTLVKKLRGESPIDAVDLVLIAKFLRPNEQQIIDEALDAFGGIGNVSAVRRRTNDLDTKRKEKARAMTTEQIENERERSAATEDPELDTDEPPTP